MPAPTEPSLLLAFTQTFHPVDLKNRTNLSMLMFGFQCIKKVLKGFHFETYVEWHHNGNIHFHGTIFLRNVKERALYVKRKVFSNLTKLGNLKLKAVTSYTNWLNYCTKDVAVANEVFIPLIQDISWPLTHHTTLTSTRVTKLKVIYPII